MEKEMRNTIEEEFNQLLILSNQAHSEELEISYESTLVDILNFIKKHLDHKSYFIEKFKGLLRSDKYSFEIIAFCMHELQWQEILDYVLLIIDIKNNPRDEALRTIIDAYDSEWSDADLYRYYSR